MIGKMAIFVCIAFLALSSIMLASAEPIIRLPNPKAEPGTCLIEDMDNFVVKIGEEKDMPNRCQKATCNPEGVAIIMTCGRIGGTSEDCTLVQDFTKPYPACCPKCRYLGIGRRTD